MPLLAVGQHTPRAYVGSSNSAQFSICSAFRMFTCRVLGRCRINFMNTSGSKSVTVTAHVHQGKTFGSMFFVLLAHYGIYIHIRVRTRTYVHTQSGTHTLMHRQTW